MAPAQKDDIDDFGLDEFSVEFLTELDLAEEAFPSRYVCIDLFSSSTSLIPPLAVSVRPLLVHPYPLYWTKMNTISCFWSLAPKR
jgi:hypothetical protein